MATTATRPSPQKTARIAGILYLVIALVSIVPHFYMPDALIVPGDAAATAQNIMASEPLFRASIGSELVILLSEIVLSVLLYVLFRPVSKSLSLIAAVSRLVMATIHGINLINHFFVLMLLRGDAYRAVFGADQLNALVQLFLDAHNYGFAIGVAFLTLHAAVLGYLIFQSGYFPRVLGGLFVIASLGYLIDSIGILLLPGYETTPAFLALPIVIAELAFPLWLLIKGVNIARWKERALSVSTQAA